MLTQFRKIDQESDGDSINIQRFSCARSTLPFSSSLFAKEVAKVLLPLAAISSYPQEAQACKQFGIEGGVVLSPSHPRRAAGEGHLICSLTNSKDGPNWEFALNFGYANGKMAIEKDKSWQKLYRENIPYGEVVAGFLIGPSFQMGPVGITLGTGLGVNYIYYANYSLGKDQQGVGYSSQQKIYLTPVVQFHGELTLNVWSNFALLAGIGTHVPFKPLPHEIGSPATLKENQAKASEHKEQFRLEPEFVLGGALTF